MGDRMSVNKLRWYGVYNPPSNVKHVSKGLLDKHEIKRLDEVQRKTAVGDSPYAHITAQQTEYAKRQRIETVDITPMRRNWFDSPITRKVIVTKPAEYVKGEKPATCIKCDAEVRPGFCHTGKVLEGFIKIPIEQAVFDKTLLESTSKIVKIPVSKYVRGFICDECASEWRQHTYYDANGTQQTVPVVIVDPIQSITPQDERIGFKSGKGFNTRYAQGKPSHSVPSMSVPNRKE